MDADCVVLLLCLQEVTWSLKQTYPDRILTAEITPEDPQLMAQYGFDAIWVHSGETEQPAGRALLREPAACSTRSDYTSIRVWSSVFACRTLRETAFVKKVALHRYFACLVQMVCRWHHVAAKKCWQSYLAAHHAALVSLKCPCDGHVVGWFDAGLEISVSTSCFVQFICCW